MGRELRMRTPAAQHQQLGARGAQRQAGQDTVALGAFGVARTTAHSAKRPGEQWRRHYRSDDRDRDNHRVHRGCEHAEAESQQGHDDLHPAARVHPESHRQGLAEFKPSELAAQKRARNLGRARNPEHDQWYVGTPERRQIGLQARIGEEHRRHQAHRDRFHLSAVAGAHPRRTA